MGLLQRHVGTQRDLSCLRRLGPEAARGAWIWAVPPEVVGVPKNVVAGSTL